MNLDLNTDLQLEQKLNLTPELIQAIKLLQMNALDLKSYVEEESMSNPLLELNESIESEKAYDKLSNRFANDSLYGFVSGNSTEHDDYFNLEDFVRIQWTLSDVLTMQLLLIKDIDDDTCSIARYIIDSLDENGYRTEKASEIALKLGFARNKVIEAIHIVQSLEPAGVSAKNLEECIELQLKRRGLYDEIFEKIVYGHLKDLASNRIGQIAKDCHVKIVKAQRYCDIIRSCDPKPGRRYSKSNSNTYIIPDCYLNIVDGEYIVTTNESYIPHLQISSYYKRLKDEPGCDETTIRYLNDKMNAALWLISGINQRYQTIEKIAMAIVDYQKDFFEKGKMFLRPMTLSCIADIVGVHISTVSRTTNGKYIQTPMGLFELKSFFSSGTLSNTGKELSFSVIKDKVKEIIAAEDTRHPYSDERIRFILSEQYDCEIMRRTVTKYRAQLGIPGASQRKRI